MNVFDLYAKIALDTGDYEKGLEDASAKTASFGSKLKSGLATAAKIGGAALAAASAAIFKLGKDSVVGYAEYEQLVGGVETLFKASSDAVMKYADAAYQTAGLSANEYMETVTSFSASLLQSLDGDTAAAAEKANLAITDMSDNANKMGTSMEMIQNAYQGFAKQNYTMLDNLKLGYGGTKEEMQRLLDDAEKLSGQKFDLSSYGDIVDAIHVVQTEMGIAGTTALEASTTIQGSVSAMKAAWSNLITGMADENADLDTLIYNFASSVETAASNIVPRIATLVPRLIEGIVSLVDVLIPQIPPLIETLLPALIEGAVALVAGLISALPDIVWAIGEAVVVLFEDLISWFNSWWPEFKEAAIQWINGVLEGISAGWEAVKSWVNGIWGSIKAWFAGLWGSFVEFGKNIINAIWNGLKSVWESVVNWISDAWNSVINWFGGLWDSFVSIGSDIINAIWDGLKSAWENVTSWFSDAWNSIESVFSGGADVNLNAKSNGFGAVSGTHASGLWRVPYDGYIAEVHKGEMIVPAKEAEFLRKGMGGVNITQNIYSEAKTAADLMQEAMWEAERAVLTGV